MTAIIQREDLDDAHLDSAFWLNLVWCVRARRAAALSTPAGGRT